MRASWKFVETLRDTLLQLDVKRAMLFAWQEKLTSLSVKML